MLELKDIRKKIDDIDSQLVTLLTQRLDLAKDVAEVKARTGGAVFDPERERQLLNRLSDLAGAEHEEEIRILYATLLSLSKTRQRACMQTASDCTEAIRIAAETTGEFPARAFVACPGTEGAYSQQAVSRMFELPTILYFKSLPNVLDAVELDLCPYGVLPVENMAAGSVVSVFDTMAKRGLHIVKSLNMRVNHVLLANKGTRLDDIKLIASQPNALMQCSDFIQKMLACETLTASNTAVAAKELARDGRNDMAVIASRECAQLYGLDILAEGIANTPANVTRFICISKELEIYDDVRKVSLMLSIPDTPHALSMILDRLTALKLNLSKLESRPDPLEDHRKLITMDIETSTRNPRLLKLLDDLAADPQNTRFTFLGAYSEI